MAKRTEPAGTDLVRLALAAQGYSEAKIAEILAGLGGMQAKAEGRSAAAQSKGAAATSGSVAVAGNVAGDVIVGRSSSSRKPTAKDLETAYLRHLVAGVGRVSLSGVDPGVATSDPQEQLQLQAVYTGLETTRYEGQRLFATGEENRTLTALESLESESRLVLLGDPGSGKSTFVHFVALCQAGDVLGLPNANRQVLTEPLPGREERQPWTHSGLVPVRVILRDFAAEGLPAEGEPATADHLWRFIARTLQKATLKGYASLLQKRLLGRGGLILLDGLDEVPKAQRRREQIRQAIEEFAATYGNCRFLVTSRTFAYRNQDWQLAGFQEAELAPFGDEQISRFIDRWYAHMASLGRVEARDAKGKAALLQGAIERSDRLRDLAKRPLLLTLMASLHAWRGGSLPERREELYADAVKLLLDLWERNRYQRDAKGKLRLEQPSLAAWLATDQEAVRRVLEDLAFEAHKAQPDLAGTADIAEDPLVGRLVRLSRAKGREVDQEKLVEYLSERSGILVARGEGVYTLPHRSFQEYLAACRLTRGSAYPKEIAGLARADPDRWREVLLLAAAKAAAGAGSTLWSLAESLCYREPESAKATLEDAWGAHLAGLALREAGALGEIEEPQEARWNLLRRWHVHLLGDERFSAVERAAAGTTLAELGDPRFDQEKWFLPKGPRLGFVEIPEGKFRMGSDPKRDSDSREEEQPEHEVDLPTYYMARWPVTVAQFRAFAEATEHEGVPKEFLVRPGSEPVVRVTRHDALAYSRWLGGCLRAEAERKKASGWGEEGSERTFWQGLAAGELAVCLPSEAEWEKAARGADGRTYPWGEKPEANRANDDESGVGKVSAVGCFPRGASPYGVEELAGNVWEWTRSVWAEKFSYPYVAADGREALDSLSRRVLRAGAFYLLPRLARCAVRSWDGPGLRNDFVGFRVVVSPFRSGL